MRQSIQCTADIDCAPACLRYSGADQRQWIFTVVAIFLLTGCAAGTPAPVQDRHVESRPAQQAAATISSPGPPKIVDGRAEYHEVQTGETLFSIAFQHGIDYRDLAQWNSLNDPNVVQVGQRLRLTAGEGGARTTLLGAGSGVVVTPLGGGDAQPPAAAQKSPIPAGAAPPIAMGGLKSEPKAVKQPAAEKAPPSPNATGPLPNATGQNGAPSDPRADKGGTETKAQVKPLASGAAANKPADAKPAPATEDIVDWIWPTSGRPKGLFTDTTKGIDIPGARGQAVMAAAPGKVIHVGSNLRGYGKLVIIQHSSMFLSAYAHNNQVLVKEGERVAKGQKIAEMGDTDTDQVKLHFEIRRFGKPVDPIKYLPGNYLPGKYLPGKYLPGEKNS